MKKLFNKLKHNTLFGIIIGILITSSTGVLALNYIYNSDQVSYSDKNVKESLDELYDKTKENKGSVIYLGTGTSFDIKALLPEIDYTKLTTENFIVVPPNGASGSNGVGGNGEIGGFSVTTKLNLPTISYDNITGIFSCPTTKLVSTGWWFNIGNTNGATLSPNTAAFNNNVYLVMETIQTLD